MLKRNPGRRREPLTDTMLLVTITIGIFFAMYFSAMAIWGGGFLRWQRVFDMLNDNAALIIVACGLTIVMIGGGIDISVGGVIALVVMSCVVHLNSGGSIFTAAPTGTARMIRSLSSTHSCSGTTLSARPIF